MYKKTVVVMAMILSALVVQGCQTTSSGMIVKKDPEKAAKVRTQMAAEYIRSGDLDAAKRALDQALKANSRDSVANMMMGVLLQQEGSKTNLDKADHYFIRAISIDPQNAQVRNNYGTYLYQIKRYNAAIEQFKIAGTTLGYDQRYAALENLGRTYGVMGDVANAEKSFKQALQVNRESTLSMLELSEILYMQQKTVAAHQLYQQYVGLVGQTKQSAHALWVGLRVTRANGDLMGMQLLVNQLHAMFPESQEYQRYLQLQYTTEAVWK